MSNPVESSYAEWILSQPDTIWFNMVETGRTIHAWSKLWASSPEISTFLLNPSSPSKGVPGRLSIGSNRKMLLATKDELDALAKFALPMGAVMTGSRGTMVSSPGMILRDKFGYKRVLEGGFFFIAPLD